MDLPGLYTNCRLCPRNCGVDRLAGQVGRCGENAALRLAFAGLHMGEEPPLSGKGGSGTIFVSGCNVGCAFCQNWQISAGEPSFAAARSAGGANGASRPAAKTAGGSPTIQRLGRAVSTEEFAAICLALQEKGAENVNIVTGSHAVPAIVLGLRAAKAGGLAIPVLWNSSGYESVAALELLNGLVDTWLPDLKTLDSGLAARFFNAPDYPQIAAAAIVWMMHNRPHGVIVRHLILPGCLESTRSVLRWFAENAAGKALLSLMSQYTPMGTGGPGSKNGGQERFVSRQEYETVLGWLGEFGIEDGFCQELITGSHWLPDFSRPNPFSSELSVPVWHSQHKIPKI